MGTSILILTDRKEATSEELYQVMVRYAKSRNITCKMFLSKEVTCDEILCASVVICVRGDTPLMKYLLEIAKKNGIFTIYFLDDAIKDLPGDAFFYGGRKKWHFKNIVLSDVFLTTNPLIGEDYKKVFPDLRVVLINTPVSDVKALCSTSTNTEKKIRIVYAASEWHLQDYNRYISPIVERLLDRFCAKIELVFVGMCPKDKNLHMLKNVQFVPAMTLDSYQKYMENNQFDIGLAPLEDTFFSNRKYFNKFIEYTRYGVFGLYSNVYPYKFAVKNLETGILVDNDPESWYQAICRSIEDRLLRENCLKNAQEYIRKNHDDKYIFSELEFDIPELKNSCGQKRKKKERLFFVTKKILYYPFCIREKMFMVIYSLRNEGSKSVFVRIKRKFLRGRER